MLSQTPTALAALPTEGLESLTLVVGGEACPPELVARWATPGRVMINAYGPDRDHGVRGDECAVGGGVGAVPIGVPVAGAGLFVLDGWLRPVPVGVVGELYVAGAGWVSGIGAVVR